jgi:putative transposase
LPKKRQPARRHHLVSPGDIISESAGDFVGVRREACACADRSGRVVGWDEDVGARFPAEIIGHAVWLYFRFLLGLRMVEELLAARGIIVTHETVRQWARKFGQHFANQIRRRLPRVGDKWHLDDVVLKIARVKHWLWRAVDQTGVVLDVLVQRRRDKQAAKRLLRKLLKKQMRSPRVMITDRLASYGAAKREVMPGIEHRQHKGLNNQSGEFASADASPRTANEAVQIGRPGAAFPLSP